MHNRKADRAPTLTIRVERALQEADDFVQIAQSCAITGLTRHQVDITLRHLRENGAVDCIPVEGSGLWWFATPSEDRRPRKVEERVPEEEGSRGGKARRRVVKSPPDLG